MADINIADLPTLTAAQISDQEDIRFPVDDLQAVATTKQIALDELITAVGALTATITFNQTTVPSSGAEGLYSVQTGSYRGLYMWTGVEAVQLKPYSQDGSWPVT